MLSYIVGPELFDRTILSHDFHSALLKSNQTSTWNCEDKSLAPDYTDFPAFRDTVDGFALLCCVNPTSQFAPAPLGKLKWVGSRCLFIGVSSGVIAAPLRGTSLYRQAPVVRTTTAPLSEVLA